MQLCCLHHYWYYELIRLLLCKIAISSTDLYVSSLQLSLCKGRSCKYPNYTFSTCRSHYTGGFFDGAISSSSHLPWSSPSGARLDFLFALYLQNNLTIRQDSLYVTTCTFARILSNTLSPHFIHIISYTHSG